MMDAAVIWMGAWFAKPSSIYKAQLSLALPENDGRVSRCVGKLSARGAETGTGNFFDCAEKPLGMLRQAQHERSFINDFSLPSVRPELVEGLRGGFSAESFSGTGCSLYFKRLPVPLFVP